MELEDPEWLSEPDTERARTRLRERISQARRVMEKSACEQPLDIVRRDGARLHALKDVYRELFGRAEYDEAAEVDE